MTNLADLLPAGGGQNNTDFVADGNISAGAPVILTAAGKAAPVATVAGSVGTEAVFESAYTYNVAMTYDSSQNKVVIIYADNGNSNYGTAVVGTVSDTSISFGTPVVFESAGTQYPSICFDSNANKSVLFFRGSSNYMRSIVGTVSGTSISFGSVVNVYTASVSTTACCFDSSVNKVLAVYNEGGATNTGKSIVGTVSGTSISFGSAVTFETGAVSYLAASFDSTENKNVIVFVDDDDSSKAKAIVGSISGTAIGTLGTEVIFYSSSINYTDAVYDSNAAKTVISYRVQSGSYQGEAVVATVSGHTISFGTAVESHSGNSNYNKLAFDSDNNNILIVFRDGNDGGYIKFKEGTVSGTSITFSTATNLTSAASDFIDCCYDTGSNRLVVGFSDDANSNYGTGVVAKLESSTLTGTNLLGLAPEAISDTATGTINTWGSRCENNDFFGTVTATYGSPTAASAYQSESKVLAYDSANNRFVMAYKDGSNSDYGTAVVGELSGTSITWGTPVVFESATTGSDGMDIAFDSNVNRIVIAYQDQENSSYGTAIVGSVSGSGSGSTIAFGSPTIFESADTRTLAVTFDSNDNRIVIVYSDAGNSFYATYVIGTVTTGPDAISFNTPALLNGSSATYETSASFDATENKVLVAYTDDSYDLYVLNLAISSGSGTPGTASSFGIGSPQQRFPRCVYDSVNGKSGVAYAEGTNLPIYFSVISMSGSNVTIETRVLAGDTSDSNYFMHNIAFDASIGQLAICTRDASSSKGIVYYGSISGTTSSWTTSGSLFADETILPYGVDVAYDTSANKLAFVYSPASGSNSEAVVGTLATTTLTIGSDYYVQTDGTLSTDTGGQLIGNAIKTNQINIKDYTG